MAVSDSKEPLVIIGRFGRPKGVKGVLSVISFTDPLENMFNYSPWLTKKEKSWQKINYSFQGQASDRFFVSIEGIFDRDQAAELTHQEISTYQSLLPALKEDEYYWHELIGMKVLTVDKTSLGTVSALFATGSNDVLVVEGEQRHLIPYLLGRYIIEINRSHRHIIVDWESL